MILIVDKSRKRAETIRDMLYYIGVLSYAVTPREALSEISLCYKAIVVSEPDNLADVSDFIRKIRSYNKTVPIFSLSENDRPDYEKEGFDGAFNSEIYTSTLIYRIRDYAKERDLPIPGAYHLMGIDLGADKRDVTYFDDKISFTKTEVMILRTLVSAYPRPLNVKEIMKYAFKGGKRIELSSIRTYISIINKKFQKSFFRPIISAKDGKGYVILTPEMIIYGEDALV